MAKKIEDAPRALHLYSVIDRKQLKNKAYRDMTDALNDLPGVQVIGGISSTDISIQGKPEKYTIILIDGKRLDTRNTRPNNDSSGIEQYCLPPLVVIKRIEVIRDLISSIYDSYTMSGVINIITRKIGKTLNASLRADIIIPEPSNSGNRRQGGFYLADPLIDSMLGMKENALYSCRNEDKFIGSYKKYLITNAGWDNLFIHAK
ncbi:MAG: TonB-dependent receptor plug domain-containing protein [Arsenophonus sp. NEOnobi-MAG3]